MRGTRRHIVFIFLFAVSMIIIRPICFFCSSTVQASLAGDVRNFGFSKTIRKRKETIYTAEEFALAEHKLQAFKFFPLQLLLSSLRKWQHRLLQLLSFLFAFLLALSRIVQPSFALSPQTDRYKTIAVFLI